MDTLLGAPIPLGIIGAPVPLALYELPSTPKCRRRDDDTVRPATLSPGAGLYAGVASGRL